MRRQWHAARGSGMARWLLTALLLHGAIAMLAAALPRATGSSASPAPAPSARGRGAGSDLILLDEEWPPVSPHELLAGSVSSGVHRAIRLEEPRPTGAGERSSTPARGAAHAESSQPPGTPSDTASTEGAPIPGEASSGELDGPLHGGPATLSLQQLGIGAAHPFLGLPPDSLSPAEQANRRLQASLHQGSLDGARQRGLGPEGPVVDAARRLVLSDEVLVETSAVLSIIVDAGGRVTSVDVLDAASQPGAWQVLSERLLKTLGTATLRLARPGQALRVKLRLASVMRLPSGAAPGLRKELLGQTLHGGGPGSASLSLSPTAPLRRDEVFDNAGRHQDHPIVELGLLELKGDVADIAAPARRVAQVAVLAVDALAPP